MAMLQASIPTTPFTKSQFFTSQTKPKSTTIPTTRSSLLSPNPLLCLPKSKPRSSQSSIKQPQAIASDVVSSSSSTSGQIDGEDGILVDPTTPSQSELRGEREVVDYDWTEEWYPLYLTKNVPEDAPLGLTVFDKQLVLYRDANGVLRCHEDRCPHSDGPEEL